MTFVWMNHMLPFYVTFILGSHTSTLGSFVTQLYRTRANISMQTHPKYLHYNWIDFHNTFTLKIVSVRPKKKKIKDKVHSAYAKFRIQLVLYNFHCKWIVVIYSFKVLNNRILCKCRQAFAMTNNMAS